MEKKIRAKIPQVAKLKANLQKEINSICPFCENEDVGHFEIHHIDENPSNNEPLNLILLCPTCHSKITKGDITVIDVLKKKMSLISVTSKSSSSNKTINFNDRINNAVVGDNNNITIKQPKKIVKQKYPEGCLGFDTLKANYIGHLIKRFNEYKEYEVGKENMNYATFNSFLKKMYKLGPTRTIYNVPIDKFEELSDYIQYRIDKTMLAKQKGYNHKNYSTFEEYLSNKS